MLGLVFGLGSTIWTRKISINGQMAAK